MIILIFNVFWSKKLIPMVNFTLKCFPGMFMAMPICGIFCKHLNFCTFFQCRGNQICGFPNKLHIFIIYKIIIDLNKFYIHLLFVLIIIIKNNLRLTCVLLDAQVGATKSTNSKKFCRIWISMMTDILVFTENTDSQQVKWWVYTSSSIKTSKGVSRPFLSLFFLSLLACHGERGLKKEKKDKK